MAGDGAAAAHGEAAPPVPLQPPSSAVADAWEGETLPNGSTKRKADGPVVPAGEDGCTSSKRKAAVVSEAVKPSADSMAVDGCDDGDGGDWVPAGADENGSLVVDKEYLLKHPAGVDENGDLIMDEELMEHLEWVKTLDIINLSDVPSLKVWYDLYDAESEEEGEEVVQKPKTN